MNVCQENIKYILDTVKNKSNDYRKGTIKEIFTLSKEYVDKDTRKSAKNSKKTIRQIKKIVSFITNIANNLKIIQDLKLDYSKISTNVKTIFDTISDLEQKIIAFNTGSEEIKDNKTNIITAIKNAREQKKLFRIKLYLRKIW